MWTIYSLTLNSMKYVKDKRNINQQQQKSNTAEQLWELLQYSSAKTYYIKMAQKIK